jgi:hypothetical protein
MANLSSWSENNEQAILSFEWSPFFKKNRANIAKTICSMKQTFAFIESFQRYIPSDKSIVLTKEISKHD